MTKRTVNVIECCLVCKHGDLTTGEVECNMPSIECGVQNSSGEYELNDYTHWCNRFEIDRFIAGDT